ncbi:MAG TPA: response regulator [Pyrinomonadaceae bacterium]|jgi:CheY-like chemotaxis protein|nr:response regulator [Pyrinomonadaceae bacterium]
MMQKRVLVVEDVEDSRAMIRLMIEKQGVSVIEAAGAYEAIEKAEEFQPDLILMDIGLPLLDGLSTATLIKKLKDLDETPIVAVTAYRDILEQARKAGCSDVLYKPIDQPALNDLLKKHLNGH